MAASRLCYITAALAFFALAVPSVAVQQSPGSAQRSDLVEDVHSMSTLNYTYRNFEQIRSELLLIESEHPGIAKVYDIGDSWEKTQGISDRDILALKISDNVAVDEDEPEVFVMGLIHAREWITSEIALELAKELTHGYGTDARTSWLVDNRETWIVPVVNPDGLDYALTADNMWRKNRHLNPDMTYGVDLNRNFNGSGNGDPLGSWGGAGTSNVTSNEVYCGPGPFSEPETKAIRDFVMAHDFTLALDIESYGNLVLWPWGYTTNHTADYEDLSRIGSQLATASRYASEQSIELYPTTGDCIDWLYGYAGVYAFTIEVGEEFHPSNATTVGESIDANLNLALEGIEIGGNRKNTTVSIAHTPSLTRQFSESGYQIDATVTADRGVDTTSVQISFSSDGMNWTTHQMVRTGGNDTYRSSIPLIVPLWSEIQYFISARDLGGVLAMSPSYGPYQRYSFAVIPPDSTSLGTITYTIPRQVDGSSGWSMNGTIDGSSLDPDLHFMLFNATGKRLDCSMRPGSDGRFRANISAGMEVGHYTAQLRAEVRGIDLWNSTPVPLDILDLTPPEIVSVNSGVVSMGDSSPREVRIGVRVVDLYAVESVRLKFRVNDGDWVVRTMNASDFEEQFDWDSVATCNFFVEVGDGHGAIEFTVDATDSSGNSVTYPSDPPATAHFDDRYPAQPLSLLSWVSITAIIGVVVAGVALLYLTRARRR